MGNINQNHNNVWLLRYKVLQTQLFVTLSHFLPFYNTTNPENQNLEKMKKSPEISSFYTSLPKIMIICYTLPEIWHFTDCYFSFWAIFLKKTGRYHHFTQAYQKSWSNTILFLRYGHNGLIVIFHFGLYFPFNPPKTNQPKKRNFRKLEKMPANAIILHMSSTNYDQIMYNGSWDMVSNRWTDGKSDIYCRSWVTACVHIDLKAVWLLMLFKGCLSILKK